jgi:hypothetical protein
MKVAALLTTKVIVIACGLQTAGKGLHCDASSAAEPFKIIVCVEYLDRVYRVEGEMSEFVLQFTPVL